MLVGPSEGWVGEWDGILSFTFCKHPTFLFHVFWKILIPLSKYARIDKADLKKVSDL
jgi:hypothetical protein